MEVKSKNCYHCGDTGHNIKECQFKAEEEKRNKTDSAALAAARATSPEYGSTDIRYRDKGKKVSGKDLKEALKAKNEKKTSASIRNIKKEKK